MAVIEVKNISKSFKGKKIFDNASLSVEKGEIFCLVGQSGIGKTVFLKMLAGFFKPDSGSIFIRTKEKNSIGISMQENSIYGNLTLKQNLFYFARLYNVDRKTAKEEISRLIKLLSLENFEDTLVKKLSGGTKKRLDIACSLLNNPEVLILDEPLLGLDPQLVSVILRLILYLNRKGKTIIITSHMIPEISVVGTRFAVLKNKKISSIDKSKLKEAYS